MKKHSEMFRVAQFGRVSADRLATDWIACGRKEPVPTEIRLPRRATVGSAGYDIFSPIAFTLAPGETIMIPTGVRVRIEEGWVLMLYPRSGMGFRYRLQLNNTVGVIDADYYGAPNEGHIHLKLTNDSNEGKSLTVKAGDAVCQGIFTPFGITVDDDAEGERLGGFGSTDFR